MHEEIARDGVHHAHARVVRACVAGVVMKIMKGNSAHPVASSRLADQELGFFACQARATTARTRHRGLHEAAGHGVCDKHALHVCCDENETIGILDIRRPSNENLSVCVLLSPLHLNKHRRRPVLTRHRATKKPE